MINKISSIVVDCLAHDSRQLLIPYYSDYIDYNNGTITADNFVEYYRTIAITSSDSSINQLADDITMNTTAESIHYTQNRGLDKTDILAFGLDEYYLRLKGIYVDDDLPSIDEFTSQDDCLITDASDINITIEDEISLHRFYAEYYKVE